MPLQVVALLSLVILATLVSGLLINRRRSLVLQKLMVYIVPVTTGMFLGIGFFEFIPHSYANPNEYTSVLILLGFILVVFSEKYIAPLLNFGQKQECSAHHIHGPAESSVSRSQDLGLDKKEIELSYNAACSSIGCIIVCAFFDGVEIAAASQLHSTTGFLVGIGMVLHIIPEGALVASISMAGGLSQKAALKSIIFVCLALFFGGMFSALAFNVSNLHEIALPIASGILIYTSIGHLLPIALKSRFGLVGVLVGAFAIFLFLPAYH